MVRTKKKLRFEEEDFLFEDAELDEDDLTEVDDWEEDGTIDGGEAAFLRGYHES